MEYRGTLIEIQPPEIWKEFAFGFIQDFDLLYDDMESYVSDFLRESTDNQKVKIQEFLEELLEIELDSEGLNQYFFAYGAQFCPKEPKQFMRFMKNEIVKNLRNDS